MPHASHEEPTPAIRGAREVPSRPPRPADLGSLAQRLQWLFDTVRRPDGKKHTIRAVAADIGISFGYLNALTNGSKRNPSADVLDALADFFAAPRYIFSDNPADVRQAVANVHLTQVQPHTQHLLEQPHSLDVTGLTEEQIRTLTAQRDAYRATNERSL